MRPYPGPDFEVLVEDASALVEWHSEGVVLIPVPTHGRLDDEASLGEQIEGREVLGEGEGVTQWGDESDGTDANGGNATSAMCGDSRSSITGSEAEGLLADEALIDQQD